MNKSELERFFFEQGLDDIGGWPGYVDENDRNWVPELAEIIDSWTSGQLDTLINILPESDIAISTFGNVYEVLEYMLCDDEGRFIGGNRFGKPDKQPYGVSSSGAENLVRDWLRHLGYEDAATTQYRRDGGVDVTTEEFDVQVKNFHSDFIPVSAVREILGVAVSRGKSPMFFSHSEYSFDAIEFAEKVKMPLFRFKPQTAELISCNTYAEDILKRQRNHERDIERLENWWQSLIEIEKTTREYFLRLSEKLRTSDIKKFAESSSRYLVSVDFDAPAFRHEVSSCKSLQPEECLEQTAGLFKEISDLRRTSGLLFDTVLQDVEAGFFQV